MTGSDRQPVWGLALSSRTWLSVYISQVAQGLGCFEAECWGSEHGKPGCQAYTLARILDPPGRKLILSPALLKVRRQFGEFLVQ